MADETWHLDGHTTWRDQPADRERKLEAERDRLRNELNALRAACRTLLASLGEGERHAAARHIAALVGR